MVFIFVTVLLGGAAAFVAGQALARTWRPIWHIPAYMLLLAFAVRFIHFSLFGDRLLSLIEYVVDYAVLSVLATGGYLLMRRQQMRLHYGWRGSSRTRS